jgi:hypothetical protein
MKKKVIRLTESELTNLIQIIVEEVQIEEGIFGPSGMELEQRKIDLIRAIDDLLEEYNLTDDDLYNSVDSVVKQAAEDGYDGEVKLMQGRSGNVVLKFIANPTKFQKSKFYQNVVKPMVGGMRQGHGFGSGRGDL